MRISSILRTIALPATLFVLMVWPRGVMADMFTYIALGDSLAFGVGANDSTADISNGDRGYVKPFADALGAVQGMRPTVIDLGVSGETTGSFFNLGGGLNGPNAPLRNTNYPQPPDPIVTQDSLLQTTIANELTANHIISTVTIQLGANDLYAVAGTPGFFGLAPDQQTALLLQAIGVIQANDTQLLTELRTLLPASTQIIMMGYYDPYAPFASDPSSPFFLIAQASQLAIPALNQVIQGEAAAFGALYVDEFSAIAGHELSYTYIASSIAPGNSHPNADGYAAIANALITKAVPEPSSICLTFVGTVAVGLVGVSRRRKRSIV